MDHFQPVDFSAVDITGGFWAEKQKCICDVTIFSVRDQFAQTGRFRAFDFDWTEGSDVPRPHYFWDSDIAKWMESAAYLLQKAPNDELQAQIETLIDRIAQHQDSDGYFNIYHTVVEPENRFRIRDHHELYCLGHLIEAGVAYYNATGRDRLLNLLDRYIDLVIRVFCVEKSAGFTTPGHEEIELALLRLYRVRRDRKYLDLAMFFLNERGKREEGLTDWCNTRYNQSHLPVRQQRTAEGHAVRACYLYSAMADAAMETGDAELLAACRALFDDIVSKKMYITGGIGSSHHGEAFTTAYDLPNDTAYNETCASIALAMFADRMKEIDLDAKYADIVEREWYNGILAGLSLDGKAFFYENPLEIRLADRTRHRSMSSGDRLPITQRLEVFGCSCCPPNVTRFLASMEGSVLSAADDAIVVHQFLPCKAQIGDAALQMETRYPLDGKVCLSLSGAKGKRLMVRIPGWCRQYTCPTPCEVQRGYAVFDVDSDRFSLEMDFSMPLTFYYAHPAVCADAGKCARMRGPVVYCMEGVDNGERLFDLTVDLTCTPQVRDDASFGLPVLELRGTRTRDAADAPLYACDAPERTAVPVTFIPYCGFANRGETDMTVWFRPTAE